MLKMVIWLTPSPSNVHVVYGMSLYKNDPFNDGWLAKGGVCCPPEVEANPAVLLDFLSLRDLRILLKACE